MSWLAAHAGRAFGVSKTRYDLGSSPSFDLSESKQQAMRSLLIAPISQPTRSRLSRSTGRDPQGMDRAEAEEEMHFPDGLAADLQPGQRQAHPKTQENDDEGTTTDEAGAMHHEPPEGPSFAPFGRLRKLSSSVRTFQAGKRARRILFPEAHLARNALTIK